MVPTDMSSTNKLLFTELQCRVIRTRFIVSNVYSSLPYRFNLESKIICCMELSL